MEIQATYTLSVPTRFHGVQQTVISVYAADPSGEALAFSDAVHFGFANPEQHDEAAAKCDVAAAHATDPYYVRFFADRRDEHVESAAGWREWAALQSRAA